MQHRMTKFLAILRREYLKRVRSKSFIALTILGPVLMVGFMFLPVVIAMIGSNRPLRIGVVDDTGRMYERVRATLTQPADTTTPLRNAAMRDPRASPEARIRGASAGVSGFFVLEPIARDGRSLEDLRRQLSARVLGDELDGYLILPKDIFENRTAEYYGRNVGDVFTRAQLNERLARAVNEQLLADSGVKPELLRESSRQLTLNAIKISESGEEKDSGAAFYFVLGVGFLLFIAVIMYGGVILSAVIEEKETRVVEMLFSSVRAFPLMLGKLLGVSFVALTQFAIWAIVVVGFVLFGVSALGEQGASIELPRIGASAIAYFFSFFLLGYFIYAALFAVIGSIVTTADESQQYVLVVIMPLLMAFYLVFPVLRDPNSTLAVWTSIIPLTAPVVMMVRIITQSPPFWQIALSWVLGFGTVIALVWLSARIYRTGMLMYGKRPSIPEIMRWIRQS